MRTPAQEPVPASAPTPGALAGVAVMCVVLTTSVLAITGGLMANYHPWIHGGTGAGVLTLMIARRHLPRRRRRRRNRRQ